MKNFFLGLGGFIIIAGGAGYLFKAPLWEFVQAKLTADMFIAADIDSFDPGLPVGDSFPAIKALYQGQQVTSVDRFIRDKGMLFIANRSADW